VVAKVARRAWKRGFSWSHSLVWGVSCAAAPFPAALGVAKFHLDRLRSKHPQLIEYK
jgi:hypothetical protein